MLCFQSVLYCIVLYNDVFTFLYVAVGNKLLLLLLLLLFSETIVKHSELNLGVHREVQGVFSIVQWYSTITQHYKLNRDTANDCHGQRFCTYIYSPIFSYLRGLAVLLCAGHRT